MSEAMRSSPQAVTIFAVFLAGLGGGYVGHGMFAGGGDCPSVVASIGVIGSGEPLEPKIALQFQRSPIVSSPAIPSAPKGGIAMRESHRAPPSPWATPDPADPIASLHEAMPDAGADEGRYGGPGPDEGSYRDPYPMASEISDSQAAYLRQSELIANLEAELNPPSWEPDESELENPYFFDNLAEIEEWEEAETLTDGQPTEASQEFFEHEDIEAPLPPL